ncbi:MAG: hypothetical protein ACR2OU_19805 [Thermomicrobiales bacterium]
MALAEEEGDFELLASVKCQFGNTFIELNNYPEAERAFRSGLEDAKNSNSLSSKAQLTGQLGHLLLFSGKLEESKCLYDEALKYYTELSFFRGVAACAANLAEIAERRGDMTEGWKQHVASFDAEILANNYDGALGSLEFLAARATNEKKLRYVLEQTELLVATLPIATLQAHIGIEESMKATAYISMRRWDDAERLLLLALADRRGDNDLRGQAVVLGRLSYIEMERYDFQSAWEYNKQSMRLYQEVGADHRVRVCCYNGASMAAKLGDIDAAIGLCCDSIEMSALSGNMAHVLEPFQVLCELIVPLVSDDPRVMIPAGEHSYERLMGLIADAAKDRDLGKLIGATSTLIASFGPGGTHPLVE